MVNQQQNQSKILLLGDSCYDEYHTGTVSRISPEAPVPVFDLTSTVIKKGMAYNVYNNLVNLGARVDIITEYRERKHRYLEEKTGQQLLRVDEKIKTIHVDTAEQNLDNYDAIVISDYNKGFVQQGDAEKIRSKFDGCFVKINQYEYEEAEKLTDELIVTYGSKKVEYKNRTYLPPSVETHDVCGAGDTFLAGLVFKYLDTYSIDQAIKFAMQAAAITVQHRGVYAPTIKEVAHET